MAISTLFSPATSANVRDQPVMGLGLDGPAIFDEGGLVHIDQDQPHTKEQSWTSLRSGTIKNQFRFGKSKVSPSLVQAATTGLAVQAAAVPASEMIQDTNPSSHDISKHVVDLAVDTGKSRRRLSKRFSLGFGNAPRTTETSTVKHHESPKPSVTKRDSDTFSPSSSPKPSRRRSFLPSSKSREVALLASPERARTSSLKRLTRPLSSIVYSLPSKDTLGNKSPKESSPSCLRGSRMLSVDLGSPIQIIDVTGSPTSSTLSSSKPSARKSTPLITDPHYGAFHSLELDLEKYRTKSRQTKVQLIRNSLLAFLQNLELQHMQQALAIEDLRRRTQILHGWWNSILDLLCQDGSQSLPALEKSLLMDCASLLMERTEWTLVSGSADTVSLSTGSLTSASDSLESLPSTDSELLAPTVHAIANECFVQNILRQMTFVVENMTLPRVSAKAVRFAGKTCAYGFIYCPGVADVLVRLWSPNIGSLQRALNSEGFMRGSNFAGASSRSLSWFPQHLHSLELMSLIKLYKNLKLSVPPPIGTRHVQWTGDWTRKFSGQESDLFYEFCKGYFTLVAAIVPNHATNEEIMCTPGMIFVQSQLLVNLDATILRRVGPDTCDSPSGSDEETAADVDASALTLSTVANAGRAMSDNRLVQLLREMLYDDALQTSGATRLFAPRFAKLLEVTVKNIPVVNHGATFTLCELLEEILPLMAEDYCMYGLEDLIDWTFWITAWRRMVDNHNTSVEIKLYSLIHALWPAVTATLKHKRQLHEFLLNPDFFCSRFNNTSPLIRAYYMRLICWRVAFDSSGKNPTDLEPVEPKASSAITVYSPAAITLTSYLFNIYSTYLYIDQEAQKTQLAGPSTIPCSPIPGRRLVIIVSDSIPARSSRLSLPVSLNSAVTQSPYIGEGGSPNTFDRDDRRPKRFSLLKGMGTTGRMRETRVVQIPSEVQEVAMGSPAPDTSVSKPLPALPHTTRTFRFSLDAEKRPFGQPPTSMRINQPNLPFAAIQQALSEPCALQILGAQVRSPPVPRKPEGEALKTAKYTGQALAEWTLIVNECDLYFTRRRMEGVPCDALVEIPALKMELAKRSACN